LKSNNFNGSGVNLLEPKKNWFINTSNISILKNVMGLLQLGEGFCLPTLNKDRDVIECIKSIENNFYIHKIHHNNTFRNKLFSLMKDIKNFHNRFLIDSDILSAVASTKIFVSQNPDVIFTKAEKSNTVVAFNRVD